jgi:hypothetical protein
MTEENFIEIKRSEGDSDPFGYNWKPTIQKINQYRSR